jgi:hypothetical protein
MKLNRSQTIYASILGASLLALSVDQLFLGPPSTASAEPAPAVLVTPTGSAPDGGYVTAPIPERKLAARLQAIAVERGLDPRRPGDPFQVPAAWLPDDGTTVIKTGGEETPVERFKAQHRLTAVMASRTGGTAIINGRHLNHGDVLDGFRLAEVRRRSAVFERDGKRVELWIAERPGIRR